MGKSNILKALVTGTLLLALAVLSACGSRPQSASFSEEMPQESVTAAETDREEPPQSESGAVLETAEDAAPSPDSGLIEEKLEELKALPADLTAEDAARYDIPVTVVGSDSTQARETLRRFYERTGDGKGTLSENGDQTVLIGQTTTEGDLIIVSVTAFGGGYLVLTDQSRDRFRDSESEEIMTETAGYLNWLISEDGEAEEVVASDRENLTWEELMNGLLSSSIDAAVDHIFIAGFWSRQD